MRFRRVRVCIWERHFFRSNKLYLSKKNGDLGVISRTGIDILAEMLVIVVAIVKARKVKYDMMLLNNLC